MQHDDAPPRTYSPPLAVAFVTWLLLVVVGSVSMITYATEPARQRAAPTHWPSETAIKRADGEHTLLMFVHPRCPCTRASFEELQRVIASAAIVPRCIVVITIPPGVDDGWTAPPLWDDAWLNFGTEQAFDRDGVEAERFGAATSGHVLLYGHDGELAFSGGITPARGHEGDNRGRHALIAILNRHTPVHSRNAVYGCQLVSTVEPACCASLHEVVTCDR